MRGLSALLLALILPGAVEARDERGECFSATVGVDVDSDRAPMAKPFLLGRYDCDPATLKFRAELEDDDLNVSLQEAFLRTDLSDSVSLSFGKEIVAYDKSRFFRPLDVLQSDRLNFDFRDTSGTLGGLPLLSLAHFGAAATARLVLSSDFENDPDGINLGLDQVILSREGFAGGADYALTLRYAEGNERTIGLGGSASVQLNDFTLLYGSAVFQHGIRRVDKRVALAATGALENADDNWFPQLALGMVVNPPIDPSLSLTFEAFHDGMGLTEREWDTVGGGFGLLPYLRQNYIGISAQRNFGPVDGLVSAIHSIDDGSSNLRFGIQFERSGLALNLGGNRSFGNADDEFLSNDKSVFLEIRIDV